MTIAAPTIAMIAAVIVRPVSLTGASAAAAIKAATLNAKLLPAIRWTPLAEANAQGRSPVLRRMAIPRTSVAATIESIASSGME